MQNQSINRSINRPFLITKRNFFTLFLLFCFSFFFVLQDASAWSLYNNSNASASARSLNNNSSTFLSASSISTTKNNSRETQDTLWSAQNTSSSSSCDKNDPCDILGMERNGCECECRAPKGIITDPNTGIAVCDECPKGTVMKDGRCSCPNRQDVYECRTKKDGTVELGSACCHKNDCENGLIYDEELQICKCPEDEYLVVNIDGTKSCESECNTKDGLTELFAKAYAINDVKKCECDSAEQMIDDGECKSCDDIIKGSHYEDDSCVCDKGYDYNESGDKCVKNNNYDDENSETSTSSETLSSSQADCPDGSHLIGDECVCDTDYATYDENEKKCICPKGSHEGVDWHNRPICRCDDEDKGIIEDKNGELKCGCSGNFEGIKEGGTSCVYCQKGSTRYARKGEAPQNQLAHAIIKNGICGCAKGQELICRGSVKMSDGRALQVCGCDCKGANMHVADDGTCACNKGYKMIDNECLEECKGNKIRVGKKCEGCAWGKKAYYEKYCCKEGVNVSEAKGCLDTCREGYGRIDGKGECTNSCGLLKSLTHSFNVYYSNVIKDNIVKCCDKNKEKYYGGYCLCNDEKGYYYNDKVDKCEKCTGEICNGKCCSKGANCVDKKCVCDGKKRYYDDGNGGCKRCKKDLCNGRCCNDDSFCNNNVCTCKSGKECYGNCCKSGEECDMKTAKCYKPRKTKNESSGGIRDGISGFRDVLDDMNNIKPSKPVGVGW